MTHSPLQDKLSEITGNPILRLHNRWNIPCYPDVLMSGKPTRKE